MGEWIGVGFLGKGLRFFEVFVTFLLLKVIFFFFFDCLMFLKFGVAVVCLGELGFACTFSHFCGVDQR